MFLKLALVCKGYNSSVHVHKHVYGSLKTNNSVLQLNQTEDHIYFHQNSYPSSKLQLQKKESQREIIRPTSSSSPLVLSFNSVSVLLDFRN